MAESRGRCGKKKTRSKCLIKEDKSRRRRLIAIGGVHADRKLCVLSPFAVCRRLCFFLCYQFLLSFKKQKDSSKVLKMRKGRLIVHNQLCSRHWKHSARGEKFAKWWNQFLGRCWKRRRCAIRSPRRKIGAKRIFPRASAAKKAADFIWLGFYQIG